MNTYRVYQVDSFTSDKFKGNPAGVVTNAEGLSEYDMQCIARELNNSETVFILPPDDSSHDVKLRYFTPTTEVPSCGHATIAAHYVRAIENQLKSSQVMQKIGIGILPIDIIKNEDYTIWMTQGTIEFSNPLSNKDCHNLLSGLGLTEEDLDERCPIQIVSTGHSKVMIGIKSRTTLNSISPNMSMLIELSKKIGCNGYYVFTFAAPNSDVLTYGRMFAPAIGIPEDPVTGNANGPLGAYLVNYGLVKHDGALFSFKGAQGEAIGRNGIVYVNVKIENDEPVQVIIGGKAVIAFKTQIEL
ncbi:PhzF family phenazine biosynthesis protein [Sporomusaceae bacterium BoRhaA]|uniref:PhzF family isomerase n=1 Tax=Pelorhabdus rhamnosifermentans TaxID=2772457 RepID=UPI001C05F07F|nr:PhzF family isomerase [Pelorhabdus rhamnosifermentans]MBU2702725.1 PhzF family phenazine biosynthesis protein [Pelorhabdus rhamnosifermentans]